MTFSTIIQPTTLEQYFTPFRKKIIGQGQIIETPYGYKKMIYADWTASGRLYKVIEDDIRYNIAPFVGNTHTETNITGTSMTLAYHQAQQIIKKHVNACEDDVIIMTGSGMTGAVNKFQRILGFKNTSTPIQENDRPIVFITQLEHHSNEITWRETIADVEHINLTENGDVDVKHLKSLLQQYKNRKTKIASVSACSNVTGIQTPYHKIAKVMHKAGGYCFVDFACSGPYVPIDMHPKKEEEKLDAIFLSMHKFLGGPGTPGVLIFNNKFYNNTVPDHPGGGTVRWVNPWNEQEYHHPTSTEGIEAREDGGTPPFLQTIKAALSVRLKEAMNPQKMLEREEEILEIIFNRLEKIPTLQILAPQKKHRLGVVAFMIEDLHYNLGVKLLNDRFGIQVRGGCACAGPYGHCLLNIDKPKSYSILNKINKGKLKAKPGWIRMSIHPVMSNQEIDTILNAIEEMAKKFPKWSKDYKYNAVTNEFDCQLVNEKHLHENRVAEWFDVKM